MAETQSTQNETCFHSPFRFISPDVLFGIGTSQKY